MQSPDEQKPRERGSRGFWSGVDGSVVAVRPDTAIGIATVESRATIIAVARRGTVAPAIAASVAITMVAPALLRLDAALDLPLAMLAIMAGKGSLGPVERFRAHRIELLRLGSLCSLRKADAGQCEAANQASNQKASIHACSPKAA